MTTVGDERDPCEGDSGGEKFPKKRLLQNSSGVSEHSSQQGRSYDSIYATIGISELEQILKQKTFTRSEIQRLMAVLSSKISEESPSDSVMVERDEASRTSGSLKKHKHKDESHNFRALAVSSRAIEEQTASPAELTNAYKGSIIGTSHPNTPMASPHHLTTIKNLPDELLSNIFIRLFSKQLAQMRSISKSWNALLSQSSFIKSHLHRSIHSNNQIILVFYYHEESYPNFKPFAAFPCQPPHLELSNFIKLPVNPLPESTDGITIIGSINGLICSSYSDSVIHIWNPSLSAVLTLPPYSMPSGGYDIKINFRFGFDPKTNDYKVVKLTGLTGPHSHAVKWWLHVEIFSMRKGTWELITERFPSNITDIIDSNYVCADGHNGHLHWLGLIGEKRSLKTIVAFDLGTKTFYELPLPDSILDDDNRSNDLGVLSGELCVIKRRSGVDVIEVWVMEEYGVAESWVKRHVFSQFTDSACPFGFSSRNEFLIENNGYLVVYDPIANKQKVLKNYCPEDYGANIIVEFVDSLVWVTPTKHDMVDDAA